MNHTSEPKLILQALKFNVIFKILQGVGESSLDCWMIFIFRGLNGSN